MTELRNPMETTCRRDDGEVELVLVDEEDPQKRVTFRFSQSRRCREIGRYLVDAAMEVERAEMRGGDSHGTQ